MHTKPVVGTDLMRKALYYTFYTTVLRHGGKFLTSYLFDLET